MTYGSSQTRGQIELQLLAYTTATATWDPSRICNLYHSSGQHQIFNPLSKSRDWTHILIDTSWSHFRWTIVGTPDASASMAGIQRGLLDKSLSPQHPSSRVAGPPYMMAQSSKRVKAEVLGLLWLRPPTGTVSCLQHSCRSKQNSQSQLRSKSGKSSTNVWLSLIHSNVPACKMWQSLETRQKAVEKGRAWEGPTENDAFLPFCLADCWPSSLIHMDTLQSRDSHHHHHRFTRATK